MPIPLGVLAVAGAGGAVAGAAYELLETQVLGTAVASISFSNLDTNYGSTYQHLQIRATTRSTRAGEAASQLFVRINGDTGSNYSWHYMESRTATSNVGSDAGATQTDIFGSWMPAATATANAFGAFILDLLDPFEANKNRVIRMLNGAQTFNVISLGSGMRNNTATTTSITIGDRLSANLAIGSRFSLYGMRSS
jgi:hypothetical protein